MATIQINDANYYYELHGQGYPLILISGYTRDNTAWLPLLDQLSKHFQVLIFDNRGVGRTTDSNIPLTIELMAEEVILLSEKLALKKPHVIGQSMGGNIAQFVAIHHSDKINKLGIIVSSPKWRHAMLSGLYSTLLMRENNVNFDIIFEAVTAWVFGEKQLSDKEWLNNYKQLILNYPYPQSIENQRRQFQALRPFDSRHLLKNITAETLIVHGLQDLLTLLPESELMMKEIPNAKLLTTDCAHGVIVEQTQWLARALIDFFKTS